MPWRNERGCIHTPYKPRDKNCSVYLIDYDKRKVEKADQEEEIEKDLTDVEKEDQEEERTETAIPGGINKLLDEKEVEKEDQEEQDEKKHYLVKVKDEKGAEDNGEPELDDEGHGKDLNKIMSK